jgi:hypothetical protein
MREKLKNLNLVLGFIKTWMTDRAKIIYLKPTNCRGKHKILTDIPLKDSLASHKMAEHLRQALDPHSPLLQTEQARTRYNMITLSTRELSMRIY